MAIDETKEMERPEIEEFLTSRGTGVLSLAEENVPYSIPVSYGYAREDRCFYLRLGFLQGSEKRRFIDVSAQARLVIYARIDDWWKSVIAVGVLTKVDDDELTVKTASTLRQAEMPLFDVWEESMDEIEFQIYRFETDQLTGRKGHSRTESDGFSRRNPKM